MREHEVGDEDRGEPHKHRRHEARSDVELQQRIGRDDPRDRERREQGEIEQLRAADPHAPGDLDRGEDGEQHAGEHERVDEPGRAEQEGELDDRLRLEQQERDAHEEEVDVRRASCAIGPDAQRVNARDATRISARVSR